MNFVYEVLFSTIWAGISFAILYVILPGIKKEQPYKCVITFIYLSAYYYFSDTTLLIHQLVLYASLMLIMIVFFNRSSFISSISAVLLFVIQTFSSVITSNIIIFIFRQSTDFRVIYHYHNFLYVLIYMVVALFLIKYYKTIMRIFQNLSKLNQRFERTLFISNALIFALVLYYQKITFRNMHQITHIDIENINGLSDIHYYMFSSYLILTGLMFLAILLINRLFIIDNKLENYKNKADIDQMTGVLSRTAGISHLRSEILNVSRKHYDLTIAYIDVNDLKLVNDKFGHKEGDKLLKTVTDCIQSNLREFDVIARLGGDEFMIIFSKCNDIQAKKIWRRICDEFTQINIQNDYIFKVSASAGFSQYDQSKHKNMNDLLNEADEAMYQNKKQMKEFMNQKMR